jgi:hypothetical protein
MTLFSKMSWVWYQSQSKKCTFMVFVGFIIGFIVFKVGKLPNPKNIL